MSDRRKDGGAAFPTVDDAGNLTNGDRGVTLRDYFAAKAMQGSLARMADPRFATCVIDEGEERKYPFGSTDVITKLAYEIADAMLKAREP